MLCFGLLVMFCEPPKQAAVDSYCQVQSRLIQNKEDATDAQKLNLRFKQRLAASDINYRCLCEKWTSPLCRKSK